jgi:hypothetical protein
VRLEEQVTDQIVLECEPDVWVRRGSLDGSTQVGEWHGQNAPLLLLDEPSQCGMLQRAIIKVSPQGE